MSQPSVIDAGISLIGFSEYFSKFLERQNKSLKFLTFLLQLAFGKNQAHACMPGHNCKGLDPFASSGRGPT